MKNVVLVTKPWYDEVLSLPKAIRDAGFNVKILSIAPYHATVSYWEKKLNKLTFGRGKNKYEEHIFSLFRNTLLNEQPDVFLFIDPPPVDISLLRADAKRLSCQFICWLVDPIEASPEFCQIFDAVYSFEKRFCREGVKYVPVGYSAAYEEHSPTTGGRWDITFIGSSRRERLPYLDAVATAAKKHGWKFRVDGIFYENMYFWKKSVFHIKHPDLFLYTHNHIVSSAEAAGIYQSSRIVLNLHGNGAESPNPRTYDILASGAFELIDKRSDYDILQPGTDLDVFQTPEELVRKIDCYLAHDKERIQIAQSGHKKVLKKRALQNSIQMILGDCDLQRD